MMATMKCQAVLILFSIVLGIIIPPVMPAFSGNGNHAVLGTLDVCHSAMPALSSNGDMPCMNECPCMHPPLEQSAAAAITVIPFKPSLFVSLDERPPKA